MKQELESPPVATASTTTCLTEPSPFCCHRELGLNHDPPDPTLCSLTDSLSLKLHSLKAIVVWLSAADLLCYSFGLILGARESD